MDAYTATDVEACVREIDLANWPRRQHFEWFTAFDDPRFHLGARVRLGSLRAACRRDSRSVALTMVWLVTAAANAVPELRQRVRGDRVVEHDVVHPSFTVMGPNDLFTGCLVNFDSSLDAFVTRAGVAAREASRTGGLTMTPAVDDARIFVTSVPWLEVTSMVHPRRTAADDTIPTLGWGRIDTADDGDDTANVVVTAHHALADGVHVARFVNELEARAAALR